MNQYAPWLTENEWINLPVRGRALLIANYYEKMHVRETGGANRGPLVELFLRSAGLDGGYPWCAAYVAHCLILAGYTKIPKGPAAVRNWAYKENTRSPSRGDLFFWLNRDGTGHMGFVVRRIGLWMETIEANTSSGDAGSQREGDGLYRRTRLAAGKRFIRIGTD